MLSVVLQAIIPVFGAIAFGYALKRRHFPGDAFWPMAEKMTYYFFLPALFFKSTARADFSDMAMVWPILGAVGLAMFIQSLLSFAAWPMLALDKKSFASFHQGAIRFNNYVGIPIILTLFSEPGLVIYAIMIALAIPLSNALTILVMERYATDHSPSLARLGKAVIKNPLIIGALGGVLVNLCQLPLTYLSGMVDVLASASLALGLMTVGAGIDLAAIRGARLRLLMACFMRLLVHPALVFGGCWLFGVAGMARDIALIYAALPVAASSYVLAKEHHANASFMASIIVSTTLASGATLTGLLLWMALR